MTIEGQTDIITNDVRAGLAGIPRQSVDMCITSPPYFGLRAYNTQPQAWGGIVECGHEWDEPCHTKPQTGGTQSSGLLRDGRPETTRQRNAQIAIARSVHGGSSYAFCLRCDAWRGELGQEPTLALYLAHLVEVFGCVRRVLKDNGTLWLNLGDSYAGSGKGQMGDGSHSREHGTKQGTNQGTLAGGLSKPRTGLPNKCLMGIPWRVALALVDDGWILRNDIIWHKPNAFPGSQTDRYTSAHEYLFLFAKSNRYFFDLDAVKEPAQSDHGSGNGFKRAARRSMQNRDGSPRGNDAPWTGVGGLRTPRDVWSINTAAYPEAHFATFPPKLVEGPIMAGCPVGGTVLDPFLGSGTTAMVANRMGRHCIGIELHPDYITMARRRLGADVTTCADDSVA